MISFNTSFENINVVVPDPKISFWVDSSTADITAANPNDISKILADGLSTLTLPIKGKPVFSNGLRSLLRNPSDCSILES